MNAAPCLVCRDDTLRALVDALKQDDIDRALVLGLLDARPEDISDRCSQCNADMHIVTAARDQRLQALAARGRYRARQARLDARAEARTRKRTPATPQQPTASTAALPPAAAAALARAKARVAAKRPTE